ncbi:MAG: hypothetical protein O3A80_02060 [bacterium]|nr:hypothetical protein [bacterium]
MDAKISHKNPPPKAPPVERVSPEARALLDSDARVEEFEKMLDYLESNIVQEKRATVDANEVESRTQEMQSEGYVDIQVQADKYGEKSVTLIGQKPMRVAPHAQRILARASKDIKNPIELFKKCRAAGLDLTAEDFGEYAIFISGLLRRPQAEEFLDLFQEQEPEMSGGRDFGQVFFAMDQLAELKIHSNDIKRIARHIGKNPSFGSLYMYLSVASNPDVLDFLFTTQPNGGFQSLVELDKIFILGDLDITAVRDILEICSSLKGVEISSIEFSLRKPPHSLLVSNASLRAAALRVVRGGQQSFSDRGLETFVDMYTSTDNWNVIEEFAETFGFSQSLNRELSTGGSDAGLVVSDTSLLVLMQDSEFRSFCNHLVQEYSLGINTHVLHKELAPLWRDREMRTRILNGEGAHIARHYFGGSSRKTWHGAGSKDCWEIVFTLQAKYPELAAQLDVLSTQYGFEIKPSTLSIIARSDTENMNDKEFYRDEQEQLEGVRQYLSDADFRSQFTEDNPQLRTTVRMLSENAGYSMRLRDVEIISSTDYSTGDDALVLRAATTLHNAGLDFHIITQRDVLLKIAKANFENTLVDLSETERKFTLKYLNLIIECNPSKRMDFVTIFKSLSHSPSSELRFLDEQLAMQLINLDKPLAAYQKIASVFEKNNLPIAAKIAVAFQVLYPASRIYHEVYDRTSPEILQLTERGDTSTSSKQRSARRVQDLMIRDLMLIHVRSGENSLREFLESSSGIEELLLVAERDGVNTLTAQQQEVLHFGLLKLETLLGHSRLGQRQGYEAQANPALIEQRIRSLRESLGAEGQQTATDRLAQIFLRPLGINTVQEAIDMMNTARTEADTRNRDFASGFTGESSLELSEGDMMHGADAQYLGGILSRGLTCGEMLGAKDADSDFTPFDVDFGRVLSSHLSTDRLETPLSRSPATLYANSHGHVLFLSRNRGQFDLSRNMDGESPMRVEGGYETFHTPYVNDSHFGIRTGLPSSEIDGLVVFSQTLTDPREMATIYIDIVEHGVYIPIFNEDGKLVFTAEQFDTMRRNFVGLDARNGAAFDMAIIDANTSPELFAKHSANIDQYVTVLRAGDPETNAIGASVQTTIETQLATFGVEMKNPLDHSLGGARLFDIGSTGRGTYLPGGGYDFDYTLRIDDSGEHSDFEKVKQIDTSFGDALGGSAESHPLRDDGFQIRITDCMINGKSVDVDIAIMPNSEINYIPSHEAVEARFEHIRRHHGEEVYLETRANILLAKQILKDGKAYKKVENGGFGGIGVENWILMNGGNFVEACRTFKAAALSSEGTRIPLDEFKAKYSILNPGVNFRDLKHDDYVRYLTEDGYIAMLIAIETYLGEGEVSVSYQTAPNSTGR